MEALEATTFDGDANSRQWPTPLVAPPVRVATVRCLGESSAHHDTLAATADVVDLETAWIFAAAIAVGCEVRAVLAVSDSNAGGDIFESRPELGSWLTDAFDIANATFRGSCDD